MPHPPLIAHVIFHLGVGGLENGLVNLINHIPENRYRHAIICLRGFSEFHKRLNRDDVEIIALNKREGKDFSIYGKLYRVFKRLKPDIVHTRNLAAMEAQVVAAAAGVKARVHGEHGRDIFDLDGKNWKYNLLRKAIRPFIHHFITVSKDLENWLINTVKVSPVKVHQIYNGVEHLRFHPGGIVPIEIFPPGFFDDRPFAVGSVGRMAAVKDFPTLVRAFLMLRNELSATGRRPLRLIIAGEGVAKAECETMLRSAGAEQFAWLPGERDDIFRLMQAMNVFVLPSLGEGISNTVLEAMASGLPVIATRVGGNTELVLEGETGCLVPPGDPVALAGAIRQYYQNDTMAHRHGQCARAVIERQFSMRAMTNGYLTVYDRVLDYKSNTETIN
ncbi:TIGR03088 family PEP-CTERM/XrtA system glycosyltransferase [Nitrosomonas sp.]|uniref:TIGR03088 family PEP-CTERM/XrtA system glycosyltransferase n=1 Tax=Nitrosomonas sp. TaxID=42353 RepID=UPI0033067C92